MDLQVSMLLLPLIFWSLHMIFFRMLSEVNKFALQHATSEVLFVLQQASDSMLISCTHCIRAGHQAEGNLCCRITINSDEI
uniref:Uncharacterized protein n=1 Tax=Arundo donax TaxID=35708 RepID=A0A0A9B9E2_ARUDO